MRSIAGIRCMLFKEAEASTRINTLRFTNRGSVSTFHTSPRYFRPFSERENHRWRMENERPMNLRYRDLDLLLRVGILVSGTFAFVSLLYEVNSKESKNKLQTTSPVPNTEAISISNKP